jgi:hypothetical protein
VPVTEFCAQLVAWSRKYPVPLAPAGQNEAARAAEDKFLARFAGLVWLDRGQVAELVGWKFQAMAHRKALAMRGISPPRWGGRDGGPGAAALIGKALAASDDYEALATMANSTGGIYRFLPCARWTGHCGSAPARPCRAPTELRRVGEACDSGSG